MSYFTVAEKNVQSRVSALKNKLDSYENPNRQEWVRKKLGKYLGTIDELVEYLTLEESGLIDTTHRIPVKNVINYSKFAYSFHDFAKVLASIMSEIEGKEYGVFSAMNAQKVPGEYSERDVDYLNLYILPVDDAKAMISSLEYLNPERTFESLTETRRQSIIEYNNALIEKLEELRKQIGGVSIPHLLYYISDFRLLDDINKVNNRLCWKHCLKSVCSIAYLEEFLNLIVFTQYQQKCILNIKGIQALANEFAKSYKELKVSSVVGFQIPFKPIGS